MAVLCMVTLSVLVTLIKAYPHGPPTDNTTLDVCSDMFPSGHGAEPLNGVRSPPFELKVMPACYKKGSWIDITLRSTTGDEKDFFEGLFIQARDYKTHAPPAYGMFRTDDDDLKTHDCFDKPMSALSQSRADHFYEKTFKWQAGEDHSMNLVFLATVIHHTDEFWMNMTSQQIVYDEYCSAVKPPAGNGGLKTVCLPTMLSLMLAGALVLLA